MAALTIPQSFVLLLTEPDGRRSTSGELFDAGIAGAVLADLALRRAVVLDDGKVSVGTGTRVLDDEVLRNALGAIATASKPRKAQWWIQHMSGRDLREHVTLSLVQQGLLSEQQRKVLGLFPSTIYPEVDPEPEAALRQELVDVLEQRVTPTPEQAALIALLDAVGALRKEIGKAPRSVIKEITEGQWAAAGVKALLEQLRGAIIVAVAVTAATSASS